MSSSTAVLLSDVLAALIGGILAIVGGWLQRSYNNDAMKNAQAREDQLRVADQQRQAELRREEYNRENNRRRRQRIEDLMQRQVRLAMGAHEGAVELAAASHAALSTIPDDELRERWQESLDVLQEIIHAFAANLPDVSSGFSAIRETGAVARLSVRHIRVVRRMDELHWELPDR